MSEVSTSPMMDSEFIELALYEMQLLIEHPSIGLINAFLISLTLVRTLDFTEPPNSVESDR